MTEAAPPATFQEKIKIPEAGYRTAIAIKHAGRMTDVDVTFVLRERQGSTATYAAPCPRCGTGEITVEVRLAPDGSFAEAPACPTLCLPCEDSLDAILEPETTKGLGDQPGDRATLNKYLKAMATRSWD